MPDSSPLPLPAVSVVIPHLNQPELLAQCLACLAAQDTDLARIEVVVVDNGSAVLPELPAALTAGFARVAVVREATPGPGPARNRGVAEARAQILAFTDSDCQPDPGWIATLLGRFAADPGLAVLGGEIRIEIEHPGRPNVAEAFEMLYGFRQRLNIARHRFSATANMATRRAVFDAVGPFAGIDVSEDMDWGQRAAARGHATIFAPEMLVRHPARRSMAGLRAQWGRHVTHFYRLQSRARGGRLKWALSIPLMALSPLAELPNVLTSDRLPGLRSKALAFTGLVRMRLFRARRMALAMTDGAGASGRLHWNR